jgi:hypothetical protein
VSSCVRWMGTALAVLLAMGGARAADDPAGAVADYETRLEEISKEVVEIRRELEALVGEFARGELCRVFVFLETRDVGRVRGGVELRVDGETVFARPFSAAELDALGRGMPLELASLWLPPGDHRATLAGPSADGGESPVLVAGPGEVSSWIVHVEASGVEWRFE